MSNYLARIGNTGYWFATAHADGVEEGYQTPMYYTREMAEADAKCWIAFHTNTLMSEMKKVLAAVATARRNDRNYQMFKTALDEIQEFSRKYGHYPNVAKAWKAAAKQATKTANRVSILDVWNAEIRYSYKVVN